MLAKLFSSLLIILGLVSSSTPPVTIKTTTSTIPTLASTSDIIVDSKIEQVATPNSSASDSKILFEFVDSTSSPEVVDPYKILHDWEASTSLPWNILTATTGINISIVDTWSKLGGLQKSYKLGSRGEMIAYLQHALKIITNTFKKESPSGYYGPTTEQAIKELQQKFGLKPSGITEPATRYLINKFYYNQLCPKPNRKFPDLLLADVNKKSSLPPDYVPEDLVNIDTEDIQTRGVLCLRQEAATALQDIFTDAKIWASIYVLPLHFANQNCKNIFQLHREQVKITSPDHSIPNTSLAPQLTLQAKVSNIAQLIYASVKHQKVNGCSRMLGVMVLFYLTPRARTRLLVIITSHGIFVTSGKI